MKKFLEVQLFLRILLRDKMERFKAYYEPYEIAFLKIKAQTVNFIFYLERQRCQCLKN